MKIEKKRKENDELIEGSPKASISFLCYSSLFFLHVVHNSTAKLRALEQLLVALHQTLKVIRHRLVGDGTVHALQGYRGRGGGEKTGNGGRDEARKGKEW